MDIREVRRRNLKALMDREYNGIRGAQSRLAERLGKPQNFISRCLAAPGKAGAKTIGEDFAREIEAAFGLERYAMDDQALLQGAPVANKEEKESNVIAADLAAVATPRSRAVLERIMRAASEGRLTEADLELLDKIAARFERSGQARPVGEGNHKRLREKLQNNDPHSKS